MYGWVFAAHQFGAAIAAWAPASSARTSGDYAAAFVAAGWIAIIAGFAALGIRRRAPSVAAVPSGRGMSKRKRTSLGQAMGSAIVGFDYQVFRATKPPPELVEQGKPLAPVAAADGGRLSIDISACPTREPLRTTTAAAADPDDSDAAALDDSTPANEPDPSGPTPPG